MTPIDPTPSLTMQKRDHELLLMAQKLGHTGYVISDERTGRVQWSASLFEQRKVPPRESFSREEALAFLHPEDRGDFIKTRDAAIASHKSFPISMRICCGDGSVIWEEGIGQPQYAADGSYSGLLAVVRDVTESRRDALVLREQEATYRALFDSMSDAVLLTQNGRFVDCNDAALQMFGCTRDQLIGKNPSHISPEHQPDGRASAEKAQEKIDAALGGQPQRFEWKHSRFDGSTFDAEVTLNRVQIPGQALFFGVVRDISARKAADAALKSAHDKFAGAFDSSADAMIVGRVGDRPGGATIVDANQAATRIFGLELHELIGSTIAETGLVSDGEDLREIRRQLIETGTVRNYRFELKRRDGSLFHTEINGSRFDFGGEDHYLLVVRDISERAAAERKIQDLNASLAASLKQLRDIADNLPALIAYQDTEGRFEFANKIAQEWLAASEETLRGRSLADVLPAESLPAAAELANRYARGVLHSESALKYPDGKERAIEVIYVPDSDEVGKPRGRYTFVLDITERKAAEAALKAAHEKFASAFEYSTDAMWVSSVGDEPWSGAVVDVNQAAERMLGRPREDVIGKEFADLKDTLQSFPLEEYRRLVVEVGHVSDLPLEVRQPNGEPAYLLVSGSRFHVGDKAYTLTILRDVTSARAAERQIRELNESLNNNVRQLRDIIDNLPVLISYQDKDGRFLLINKTGQTWLARDEDELLGRTVPEVMSKEYVEATRATREQRQHGDVRVETTFHYPDGVVRTVDTALVRDLDEDGTVRGYYTFASDVSERKATEEQLRQSQKMEAIGKLTGGIAHDFNNLLAIILGNLELADTKLKDKDEAVQKLLAPALRAADRGATLTRSLLAFARQQPLSPSVFVVTGLIRDMTNLLSRTVPANIQIEFVGGAGLWKCEADAGQLQNALLNLVVNARDAMPEGGKLTIETSNVRLDDDYARAHSEVVPGQYVMLAVSDTGTGMPPQVITRVFEPFFTTKGLGRGTGLGLSMVYGFAKQSKGHVAIYSEVGQGTTVRIYLPRWLGKDEEKARKQSAEIPVANNETILVVEDDEDVRFIIVTILRSLGYTVLEAETGKQALVTLNATKGIALIVTDVVLAGDMNGKRVADAAKAMQPGIKVLFMSGYTENAIVHHGRLDAGVHFVQKPFRKQDLAVKVRAALDDTTP